MEFYYNQQYLPQFMGPYTYYLSYLPNFSAQNYAHSTFAVLPLQGPQIVPNLEERPTLGGQRRGMLEKKEGVLVQSSKKHNFYDFKSTAIQNLENKKREQQAKKSVQKQSRNVLSNLLRILFKNIIEVRMYQELIIKIIESNQFQTSPEEFYQWLESYGINFKNYIRFASVKKIMGSKKRKDHLVVFRIVLDEYIKVTAITHCLTSKRIDKDSVKMHLQGLRQLKKELLQI